MNIGQLQNLNEITELAVEALLESQSQDENIEIQTFQNNVYLTVHEDNAMILDTYLVQQGLISTIIEHNTQNNLVKLSVEL